MRAEYPPHIEQPFTVRGAIFLLGFMQCGMHRMEVQCPNETNRALLCQNPDGSFGLPICSLCEADLAERIDIPSDTDLARYIKTKMIFGASYRAGIAMSDVRVRLIRDGVPMQGRTERAQEMEIADVLRMLGAQKVRTNVGARWLGVAWR